MNTSLTVATVIGCPCHKIRAGGESNCFDSRVSVLNKQSCQLVANIKFTRQQEFVWWKNQIENGT